MRPALIVVLACTALTLTWTAMVPKLVETLADGTTITATFTGNRTVTTIKAPPSATATRPAK